MQASPERLTHPAPETVLPPLPCAQSGFDPGAISRTFLGDREVFRQARVLFLQQARSMLTMVASDVGEAEVRQAMHRIRGAAVMLGAQWLAAECLDIEQGPAITAMHWPARLARVQRAFEAFVQDSAAA